MIDSSTEDVDGDDGRRILGETVETDETSGDDESDVAELDLSEWSVDDDGGISSEEERRSVRRREIGRELREGAASQSGVSVLVHPPSISLSDSQMLAVRRTDSQRRKGKLE